MTLRQIAIGHAANRKVYFTPERRSTHLHVIGGSGKGKSKFLEHMIREDILAGHGLCFIDPHGETFADIVTWCARNGIEKFRRIHIIDPSVAEWRTGFNPLQRYANESPLSRIDHMIEALTQVWGGERSTDTPAIRTVLRTIFCALAERDLTLAEAFPLTRLHDENSLRAFLTAGVTSPVVREVLEGYQHMAERVPRDFLHEFGGPRRRLLELLHDDHLREMFGQAKHSIDFRRCMDEGDVVLVNLSEKAMDEGRARALGALLIREMFLVAKRRDANLAQKHPFYLYIDECGQFLTSDINSMLAQTRKFGLHAVLAHQWLEQLREASPAVYAAVMGIQNKVVFGGLSDIDAHLLADELFRSEYDIEMPVAALIKPTVIGYVQTWLHNWTESSSECEVEGENTSASEATSAASAQYFDEYGYPVGGISAATGTFASSGKGSSSSQVSASGRSEGESESYLPQLEDRPSAVHSLESVRHLAVKRLRNLPAQHAVVKGTDLPSFDMTTFNIDKPIAHPDSVASFVRRVMTASPYTLSAAEAQQTIAERASQLALEIKGWKTGPEIEETAEEWLG